MAKERQVDKILGGLWKKDAENKKRQEENDREWQEYSAPKKYDALFDFIKKMFLQDGGKTWEGVTPYEKQRNAFMVNRFMSIKYPLSASNLNALKCDGVGVVETWRHYIGRATGGRIPSWVYTKTSKAKKDSPLAKVSKEAKLYWCNLHECGFRDLEEQYKYNPTVLDDLKYIEDNLLNVKPYKEDAN